MSYQEYNQNLPPGYAQQTSSLAIVSLIAGIASFFFLPFIGAIVAVITGGMAKKEIYQSRGRITGEGMAKWGLVLGWINIGLTVAGACLAILSVLGVFGAASGMLCLAPFANYNY
jgi:hypothetical protein